MVTSARFVKGMLLVLLATGVSRAAGPTPDEPVAIPLPAIGPPVPNVALDEATFKRSVFRHIYVGALNYPGVRLTWVLLRSPTRARLRVLCQNAKQRSALGLHIDGTENDEASWLPPVVTDYEGIGSPKGFSVRASNAIPVSDTCARWFPKEITLTCRPATVTVLAAGAVAKPGAGTPDGGSKPARWTPARREPVSSMRCSLPRNPNLKPDDSWLDTIREVPLEFVEPRRGSPGIEWVYENSDLAIQEGAYRWMPAPL